MKIAPKITNRVQSLGLPAMGAALFVFLLAGAPAPAAATTITFESLATSGNNPSPIHISSPYTEAGFQFTAGFMGFNFWTTGNPNSPAQSPGGSTALSNDGGFCTLTRVGGGEFSIQSFDLMAYRINSPGQTLIFEGMRPDGSFVSQVFMVPASGSQVTENLFTFNSLFNDVISVTFPNQIDPFFQFDNVTVSGAVPDSGGTILLMFVSVAALLVLQRVHPRERISR